MPLWFYDMGGFEKEENNQYLIRFAVNMYKEFGHKVKQWVTLNEPSVSALGERPSGQWGCMWARSKNERKCNQLLFLYLNFYSFNYIDNICCCLKAAASLNYVIGMGPPGRRMDFKSAAKVVTYKSFCSLFSVSHFT